MALHAGGLLQEQRYIFIMHHKNKQFIEKYCSDTLGNLSDEWATFYSLQLWCRDSFILFLVCYLDWPEETIEESQGTVVHPLPQVVCVYLLFVY